MKLIQSQNDKIKSNFSTRSILIHITEYTIKHDEKFNYSRPLNESTKNETICQRDFLVQISDALLKAEKQ